MAMSARGGLGVLGREGLVNPVSLVSSAVEAKLMLLTRERRRCWVLVVFWGMYRSSSEFPLMALVNKEDFFSVEGRMVVRWKSFEVNCCFLKFISGGSSASSISSEPWATQGVSRLLVMVVILVYREI
jgi:hypothetical protein